MSVTSIHGSLEFNAFVLHPFTIRIVHAIRIAQMNPSPSSWTTVLVAADEVMTPAPPHTATASASLAPFTDSDISSAGSDASDSVVVMANDTKHPRTSTDGRDPSVIPAYARCSVRVGKWSAKIFPILVMASMCDCIVAFLGLIFGQNGEDLVPGHLETLWSVMAAIIGVMTACVCKLLEVEHPITPELKTRSNQKTPSAPLSENTNTQTHTTPTTSKALPFIRWTIFLVTAMLLLVVALWFRVRRQMGSWCGRLWFRDDRASATCFALVSPIVLVTAAIAQRWWYLRQISLVQKNDVQGEQHFRTATGHQDTRADRVPHAPSTAEVTHMSFVLDQLQPDSAFEVRVRSIVHDTRTGLDLQPVRQHVDNDTSDVDNAPDDTTPNTEVCNRENTEPPTIDDDGNVVEAGNKSERNSNNDKNENEDATKNQDTVQNGCEYRTQGERRWCSQWSPADECLFQTALALKQRLSRPGRLMVNQVCRIEGYASAWL